jgi:hypothetical protein
MRSAHDKLFYYALLIYSFGFVASVWLPEDFLEGNAERGILTAEAPQQDATGCPPLTVTTVKQSESPATAEGPAVTPVRLCDVAKGSAALEAVRPPTPDTGDSALPPKQIPLVIEPEAEQVL